MRSLGAITTDFDFDTPGKRSGFIDLTYSDNDNAFSVIRLPVGVIKNGHGPTILLTAGSHGDEYEGQVILHRLMQTVAANDIQGRIILLPALNMPAVRSRSRVSPLDHGNMNRSFGLGAGEGPTSSIAKFIKAHLIPMADVILDFHSGGSATQYVNCGFLCLGPDKGLRTANLKVAEVFGAPFTMVCSIDGSGGDFDTAAHAHGTRFLACELGGLGQFSLHSFKVGWQGVLRVLAYLQIISQKPSPSKTRFIDIDTKCSFITASHHGLAEFHVSIGDTVSTGAALVTLYDPHNFGEIFAKFHADHHGVIAIIRRNPMVLPGDHLCLLAQELRPEMLMN
jgi:predicted deacylase